MATPQTVKNQIATRTLRPMSPAVAEVRTNINLMVEVMRSCMVRDMHFGIIPGVQKPSLFKAGAEKLMATFRLSADPIVEDLSKDGEIRFRVKVNINAKDGTFVGAGIGECSSGEEKFSWRAAICQEEFDCTEELKRRIKFKKDYQNKEGFTKSLQVRCNPSDLANTILKMAKKRALVDGVLTATGASDLFSQDIEDLPEGYIQEPKQEQTTNPVPTPEPEPKQNTENKPEQPTQAIPYADLCTYKLGTVVNVVGKLESMNTKEVGAKKTKITRYGVGGGFIKKFGDSQFNVGDNLLFIGVKVGEYNGEPDHVCSSIDPVM